jgi:hypothetical protein
MESMKSAIQIFEYLLRVPPQNLTMRNDQANALEGEGVEEGES